MVSSVGLILGGDLAVLQAPTFDGLSFNPFSLFDDGFCATEICIGGRHIIQALMITLAIAMFDDGLDLGLKVTGQKLVFR